MSNRWCVSLISLFLILFSQPCGGAAFELLAFPQKSDSTGAAALKNRALEIPLGATIEVRLLTGEKLRGSMGEVADDGFVLWQDGGGVLRSRNMAFAEIASIKEKPSGGGLLRPLAKSLIVMGVLAGVILWAASSLK